jgi:protein-tyrosine kinase
LSKAYEALEHARQRLKHSRSGPADPVTSRLEVEHDMLELYQSVQGHPSVNTGKIYQFIGSAAREGTSTLAREFARTVALRLGKSVLLLDADPESPTHHRAFNINITYGINEVIKEGASIVEALYRVDETSLFVGTFSVNSNYGADLFDPPKINSVWEQLRKRFDVIVVDSPPGGSSPIGFALCRTVDGVIIVLEAEKTRWPVVVSTKKRILQNGGTILGVVLNKRKYHIPDWVYRRL